MNWTCPECGKSYRRKNQWHSCYVLNIEDHMCHKPEKIRELIHELLMELDLLGEVEINPIKSIIQVRAGATFLSIKPKKDHVELEFQLGEKKNMFPVHRTVRISGKRVLHFIYLESKDDINKQLIDLLKASYMLVSRASQ